MRSARGHPLPLRLGAVGVRAYYWLLAVMCLAAAACGSATSAGTTSTPAGNPRSAQGSVFSGLRYHDAGTARIIAMAAPPSGALGGTNDLLSVGQVVLAATDTGLARSVDGRASWTEVLTGIPMWSLTAAATGGFVALGERQSGAGPGQPVIATSLDGVHWGTEPVRLAGPSPAWPFGDGYRIAFSGIGAGAVGIAVPDIVASSAGGAPLRSTDGGRDWSPLSLQGATSGLDMLAGGRTVYTTAPGPNRQCAGAVYRSVDGGATWALLPASCQPYPLYSVQFLDATDGFAAGGAPAKLNGAQVVEATTDGATSWQTRWRTPPETGTANADEIVRLDMVDAQHGWALTGGCVGGENGPCGGSVYVTSDGGATWNRTAQTAVSIAGISAARAVAGDSRTGISAVTIDGGRTWRSQAPPGAVATAGFSGAGGWLLWLTSLGTFQSRSSADSWKAFDPPAMAGASDESWSLAPPGDLLGIAMTGAAPPQVRASSNDGVTWNDVGVRQPTPSLGISNGGLGPGGRAALLTGSGQCLSRQQIGATEAKKPGWKPPTAPGTLFTSSDSGRHWQLANGGLAFSPSLAGDVAVSGPLLVAIDACGNLQVSTNGGHSWQKADLGSSSLCSPSAYRNEVWIECGSAGAPTAWVLHSTDAAATWSARRFPAGTGIDGAAPALSGIVAIGPRSAVMPAGGSLWITRDGGKTWTQSWPALPGEG